MKSRGLGDTIAKMTTAVGIKPCGGCEKRKEWLNKRVPYRRALVDVVYPLASGNHGKKQLGSRWDNNELRYSLRSIEKYFYPLARVFIVTEILPDWLTNVYHIYAKDTHTRNKDANLIDKVLLACRSGVLAKFIRMSDDQCLLREWDGEGIWHMGDNFEYEGARNKWWKRYGRTCEYLKSKGYPTYFYDCHCPIQVGPGKFIRAMRDVDYATPPGMCINTLYCNSIDMPREEMNGQKIAVKRKMSVTDIRKATNGKLFLGYNDRTLSEGLKEFLQQKFPAKSRFEK